mmetsp:Transcript_35556/g.65871  ORF Transcript_35556/g.65871 Transcript_35556/m.65871 type:complete len:119 (-) Transcript_35556:211-567(-)
MKKGVSHDIGDPLKGSRKMPDGRELTWTISSGFGKAIAGDGVVPFVLDWHESFDKKIHPAQTSPQGCTLVSLKATHPKHESLARVVDALCPSVKVSKGEGVSLSATIRRPDGTEVVLS